MESVPHNAAGAWWKRAESGSCEAAPRFILESSHAREHVCREAGLHAPAVLEHDHQAAFMTIGAVNGCHVRP